MNAWLVFTITKLRYVFPFLPPLIYKSANQALLEVCYPGIVMHAFNSGTPRDRNRTCSVIFEMSLVYTVISRPARATN